jgi:hypothetical protein
MKALGIAISSSPTAGLCQSLPEGLHHSSNARRRVPEAGLRSHELCKRICSIHTRNIYRSPSLAHPTELAPADFLERGKKRASEPVLVFRQPISEWTGLVPCFLCHQLNATALVEAITGLRYVIIFAGSYALTVLRPKWLREDFSGAVLFGKSLATTLVVAGLVLIGLHGSGPETQTSRLLPLK